MPAKEGRRHMSPSGQKKGAIELSLSFIVTVVFAVVLLSLAIMWLQGFFGQLPGISNNLVQQAQAKIQDTFANTQSNFAIWPTQYPIKAGDNIRMCAGIKNDADDGMGHDFAIKVELVSASLSICSTGDVTTCGNLKTTVENNWLSYNKKKSPISIGGIDACRPIDLTVPANAKKGNYIFDILACKDVASSDECTAENMWGGSAQHLTLTVN